MREGWEILFDPPMPRRAMKFMAGMAAAKPEGAEVVESYRGAARWLMLYGAGSPRRMPVIRQHLSAGGHVAMWDLGYWNRERAMRLSIDAMHPDAALLARAPGGARREFELREDADPTGPIVLVGLGIKSVRAHGLEPLQWEGAKAAELAMRFPGKEIIWRPKGRKPIGLDGLRMEHEMPIADLLRGAALVVCRHSNVAVDACIAGIPVECEGGAGAVLYTGNPAPTREQRAEFLRRLSWFEWSRAEPVEAWQFLQELAA